ncbi:nocobactin polyketide synthase NbtC [Gordonia sp. LSe1-13]|uniref:Nocobactin polyketide synthase NbtC n=1 Tax=Gordonia sesuvii TaxID=3116777 RepID=A0ABU7MB48_9ACTN|nr:nocobactin polyketide synthase NbtC [Gordonia sp. LSe1-13]
MRPSVLDSLRSESILSGPRLPDGRVPVLVSSDAAELVPAEAAALGGYLRAHPDVSPTAVAAHLLRTRPARRHRALVLATGRDQLIDAIDALADDRAHPDVVRGATAATRRRIAYTFPGQGGQRPGMGRGYYELSEHYRRAVDECHIESMRLFGTSPRDYVLGDVAADDPSAADVRVVQPALFMQMVGLTAMWDAAGVTPALTVGHSQGEIAACHRSGAMTLADSLLIVTIRARLVHEHSPRGHTMAVVGIDVDECEDMLARHSGWAQLSVVNSAHILCISGKRDDVLDMVETLTAQGRFAKEIRVEYPAHTSYVSEYQPLFIDALGTSLQNPNMLPGTIPSVGATLGAATDPEMSLADYWFWNLRNRVRFDKAIADAATRHDADYFVEMSEHPTLLLAIGETLAEVGDSTTGARQVIGTSRRDADGLAEFTRNVAAVAVADTGFRWEALAGTVDEAPALPLEGFPNTVMRRVHLWADRESGVGDDVNSPEWAARHAGSAVRRLAVEWRPLKRRKLLRPRRIAIIDPTGQAAGLAAEIAAAAADQGAVAEVVGSLETPGLDADTVLMLAGTAGTKPDAVTDHLTAILAGGRWRAGAARLPEQFWWLTVGGERVTADDPTPDVVHGAITSALRCAATEHPAVRFRHLDLDARSTESADGSAAAVVSALHVADEPEMALRGGTVFVKRLAPVEVPADAASPDFAHILITGGTGKLGMEFCEYLAAAGAGRITLLSRSGGSADVRRRVDDVARRYGVDVHALACDITDEAAIDELVGTMTVPVSLIVHTAMNYVSTSLDDITADQIDTAIAAKVAGLRHIVRAAPRADDCSVLICSSVAATLGGRDQALYALANRITDIMATELRADGVRAASVQWGLWRVQGPLDDTALSRVAGAGVIPMAPPSAIAAGLGTDTLGTERSLGSDSIVMSADWDQLRDLLGVLGAQQILAEIPAEWSATQAQVKQADPETVPSPARPAGDPAPQVTQENPTASSAPGDVLKAELAAAMGLSDGDVDLDPDLPLVALGLDSLQALDLRKRVQAVLGRDLPVEAILGGASLREVIDLMGTD